MSHANQSTRTIGRPGRAAGHVATLWPGLALATAITLAAFGLRYMPGLAIFSPLILAIIVAVLFNNVVGTPERARPGIAWAMRPVLRAGIVLLGLQLTVQQILSVGVTGLAIVATGLLGTFLFTIWAGRLLKVDAGLTELIAAGTSICGASAVIATNTVTRAHDEDVAYAVACVTAFGSLAMFLYPVLQGPLGLDAPAYGLWAGASIHEVAQVVAASFQGGQAAGDVGTISKLARVVLLGPMVIALGLIAVRRGRADGASAHQPSAPIPWFVFGFLGLIVLNSVVTIPESVKTAGATVTPFLLSVGLAGMGLSMHIGNLRAKGLRPLLLGTLSWLFIAGTTLLLITLLGA
ncbi:YeiH family protein [Kaustia mangrovi]|uniref:YeiH family protein n=1 Tax=Kaustia mangrovi TaxID=2593653 RepID=UPI003CCDE62C